MPYDQSSFHVWGLPSVLASPISWGQQGSLETPGLLDSIWIQTVFACHWHETGRHFDAKFFSHNSHLLVCWSANTYAYICLWLTHDLGLAISHWSLFESLGFLRPDRERIRCTLRPNIFFVESYHLYKYERLWLVRRKTWCYICQIWQLNGLRREGTPVDLIDDVQSGYLDLQEPAFLYKRDTVAAKSLKVCVSWTCQWRESQLFFLLTSWLAYV